MLDGQTKLEGPPPCSNYASGRMYGINNCSNECHLVQVVRLAICVSIGCKKTTCIQHMSKRHARSAPVFVGLWGHLVDFFPDSLMPSLGQAAKVWWSNHNVRLLTPQMFGLLRSSYPKCVVCQDPYHLFGQDLP